MAAERVFYSHPMNKSSLLRDDVCTTADAASILGVTPHRVRQLWHQGDIAPAGQVGKALVWHRDQVDALLNRPDRRSLRTPRNR